MKKMIIALLVITPMVSIADSGWSELKKDQSANVEDSDSAGWSWIEKGILKNIPASYLQHNTGIVISPSDDDVKEAAAFGASDKDNKAIEYAYIIKGPSTSFWEAKDIYLSVKTPLFLVAEHARKKVHEYRDVDAEYITYCKTLDVAQISILQQTTNLNTWRAYATKMQEILLRDGKRVESVNMIHAYKGQNPYAQTLSPKLEAMMAGAQQQSALATQQHQAIITPEYIEQVKATYKSMGMSEAQINTYISAIKAYSSTSTPVGTPTEAPVFESDGIYAISELKKPGKYEVIFRTLPSNDLMRNAMGGGEKEIRFAISFDKFK